MKNEMASVNLNGAGVEGDELLAVEFEVDGHHAVVGAIDARHFRILEHRHVIVRGLFRLMVVPKKWGDFFHRYLSSVTF